MTIKIDNCVFENCGTGISAPADMKLDVSATRFIACGKAIDLRTPETLLGALGLNRDTPPEVLRDVLAFVGGGRRTEPEIAARANAAGLFRWLSAGASTAKLVSDLASLYPHVAQILAALRG